MDAGEPGALGGLAAVVVLGALGALGLRALAPTLRRLQPGDTAPQGVWLWLLGFVLFQVAGAMLTLWLAPQATGGESSGPSLSQAMPLQALASLFALGVMLIVAGRRHVSLEALGLRAPRGPSPLAVAVCALLAFYPIFVLVGTANAELQSLFGNELSPQKSMLDFLADDSARRSPLVWILMVLVLPAGEELLFRGALYGGLRRVLHPAAAIGVSALLFAVAHGNPAMLLLPVASLGVALALLYERTGSLVTPMLFHSLHNGLTLTFALLSPEAVHSP